MQLFPRRRIRADAEDLEKEVTALRAALATCKVIAHRWRRRLTAGIAALVLVLGFVLVVAHESLKLAIADWIPTFGIAQSVQGLDAAYAAFHSGNHAGALRLSRPLAEQGEARAQSLLGLIYQNGHGVPRDEPEATKWFRRAAEGGDATAQFHVGIMYSEGRSVPQDYPEAAKWYRLAADQGNAQAQYNLGIMYANGEGVPQNNVTAHMWFNLAAATFPAAPDSRNRAAAARNRDIVARKMTREEIAEAQQLARDWKPK